MRRIKKFTAAFMALAMLLSFAACGKGDSAVITVQPTEEGRTVAPAEIPDPDRGENKIKIAAPADASGLAFAKLSLDRSYAYTVEMNGMTSASASEKLKNGEVSVAVLSLEDIAKVSEQTSIKILAVNSYLKLSVVEKGETVKTLSDLKGKTVYCSGEGTCVQWVAEEIFDEYNVNAEIVYLTADELNAKVKSGEAEFCIFAEPDAIRIVAENESYTKRFDLTAGWKEDFAPVQSCIVARTDYADANPELIKEFLGHIEMCLNFMPTEGGAGIVAVQLVETGYFSNAQLALDAINACGFTYAENEEMEKIVSENYKFLSRANAEIKVPAETVYFKY